MKTTSKNDEQSKKQAGFTPYIPDAQRIPEFTIQAVLLGFLLSIIFNAANAYLGLKIGLTVSASIPSAIISMGVLRMLLPKLLGRNATILENNIVHTVASNGESLAAAIIFTVPALFFLGGTIDNTKVFALGTAGGVLGLLMMIPLRHSLVVTEHEKLPFPEGLAAAKVLICGDKGGASALPVLWGAITGAVFKLSMSAAMLFKDVIMWTHPSKAAFGYEVSPLLAGVGYLIGARIVAVMLSGALLGYWVIIPLLAYIGGDNIVSPGTIPVSQMSPGQLRADYLKYIGAGGVAFGGLLSLLKSLPDILGSLKHSLAILAKARAASHTVQAEPKDHEEKALVLGGAALGLIVGMFVGDVPWTTASGAVAHLAGGAVGACLGALLFFYVARGSVRLGRGFTRSEHDLPLPIVGLGITGVFLALWLLPIFELGFLETAIVVLFCFFFVAVSARMVGLIGTTNQPVSGMTITALLCMTLLFAFLGHDPATLKSAAIMGGAVVCIAIALSGDLSQDLKTAALLGATPWKVQLAEVMGTLVSAVRTGFILLLLYKAYGFGAQTPLQPNALEAPQSQLMAKLVEGATGGHLPWHLLLTGAAIGLVVELCGISALAFAIGLYLPIANWPMMMVGGLVAWYVAKKRGEDVEESDAGSLYASGLIAGDAIMGIVIAGLTVAGIAAKFVVRDPSAGQPWVENLISSALYSGVVYMLYKYGMEKKRA
jgi:uncharacterized oligopeptide transporter (OPT) family protein